MAITRQTTTQGGSDLSTTRRVGDSTARTVGTQRKTGTSKSVRTGETHGTSEGKTVGKRSGETHGTSEGKTLGKRNGETHGTSASTRTVGPATTVQSTSTETAAADHYAFTVSFKLKIRSALPCDEIPA